MTALRNELAPWLRLSATPGVGNLNARKLLAAFGLPEIIFAQSKAKLTEIAGPRLAEALLTEPSGLTDLLDATLAWLELAKPGGHGAETAPRRILTLADVAYPPELLQMEDPPLMLYVLGHGVFNEKENFERINRPQIAMKNIAPQVGFHRPIWRSAHSLAVVGSRNPTAQGKDNARAFAKALAESGVTVVSGLALGVDAAAHTGALEGAGRGVPTLAVVGTGLDRVYPKRNLTLAHRIAEQGLIVSEYPVGTPPLAENFPRRNRLIAALSRGTLVVEAALASGSLITARLAAEQGKEVFAIPGSIHSGMSRGCHALIRQGAKLVETVQDILEELPGLALRFAPDLARIEDPTNGDSAGRTVDETTKATNFILTAIGYDPTDLDTLQARTGLPTPTLLAQMMQMELDGQIARLAGGLYQRVATA
jgi:DNA processing protein